MCRNLFLVLLELVRLAVEGLVGVVFLVPCILCWGLGAVILEIALQAPGICILILPVCEG